MEAPPQAYEARAVRKGRVSEVEVLISRLGIDVNLRCHQRKEKGGTVLHVAARHGQLELVRYLLQLRQVEVDALDDRGKTALYRACVGKHTAIALLLAEAGADVSFSTTRGSDALKAAQAIRRSYGYDLKEVSLKRHISAPAGMRDRLTSGRNSVTGEPVHKEEKSAFSTLSARIRSIFVPGGTKEKERDSSASPPNRASISPPRNGPQSPRTADGRPKDAVMLVRARSSSGGTHVSSDPRLIRPADAVQQPPPGVAIKVLSSSPRPISSNGLSLRLRTSQTSLSSSGQSPSSSALRLVQSASVGGTNSIPISPSRSQSPPLRSQSPDYIPREPAGPRPRAPFVRSTSSPAVSDMRPPSEPRQETFLFPSSEVPDDAVVVRRLQPANAPAFNHDELSRLLLHLSRALVIIPFDPRAIADILQPLSAAVYHMSSLLPSLAGCVSVVRRNQITAKVRDISASSARLEKLLADSPSEPSAFVFESRVLLSDLWALYTSTESTAPDHIRQALRDVAANARSLTATVLDATKDDSVSELVTHTVAATLTYLRVASTRALEMNPSDHLSFMQASLAVARVVKNICASAQAVTATRALLGDDAPASATMTDLARRLAEAVKRAVQLSSVSSSEEAPTPVRFEEALTATAVTGLEDILLRPSLKSPRGGDSVGRSIGALQTALLSSSQPLVDAPATLLSLFPTASPSVLCESVSAFGEELSAHAILLLRSAVSSSPNDSKLYVAASQTILHAALQLKLAAAARAVAYPVMPISVTAVCCLRAIPAALGLVSDVILHS